jgi:hypothetical protein
MNRDPNKIVRYMAELAPAGRERTLNRRPRRDDLVVLDGATRIEVERSGTPPPMLKDPTLDAARTSEASFARYLSEERRLVGLSTSVGLDRLLDLDKLHRGENLLRVRWLFLIAKTADEFRELSQRS